MSARNPRTRVSSDAALTRFLSSVGVCGLVTRTRRHEWVCIREPHFGSTYHQHTFVNLQGRSKGHSPMTQSGPNRVTHE